MNFENPAWLYWTLPIVLTVAGFIVFGLRRRDVLLQQFAAARLLDQLTQTADMQRILIKGGLILLACVLIGIALARPQYGVNFVERKARGLDIVFVLDSSRSMLATDLRPTRLERARLAIVDLINQLKGDRIGLVVFAGNAFLQTPPTLDYSAFRENLNAVNPSSISRGGSNIGQALREAAKAFPKDNNFKIVVLLTDGEDLEEQAIDVAREIAEDGIKVYSIGIGTSEGTYLKVHAENGKKEFIRDSSGQPVRSRLDETTLQKISQLTGGSYSRLAGQSLERLYISVLATLPREERESELQETRIERYQWVLFAAIACLAVESLIRRRKTVSTQILLGFILLNLTIPAPSYAQQSVDESVSETIREIAPEKISDDPKVIYNQAHSSLVAGDYIKAIDLYETVTKYSDNINLERNSLYNMAHANHQLGEEALQAQDFETAIDYWKQSEALFKSTNELDSKDNRSLEDAKLVEDRRKALEDFLKQQQQDQQQESETDSNQDQEDSETETEADKNEQNSGESSPNESSDEQEKSQSDEYSAEQEQSDESASDSESSAAEGASDKESDKDEIGEDNSSGSADTEANDTSTESTGDPAEDMQEQNEAAESDTNDKNDPKTEDHNQELQKNSEKNGNPEGTQKPVTIAEEMDIADAQRLLDSLQNNERLLPFAESSDSRGKKRETRDW